MTRSPAPWPQEWQLEYVATIREAVAARQDVAQYARRLQILREGFGRYWEHIRKNGERSLFEVHRAEICWYVEHLMDAELLGDEEKRKLRDQYKGLAEHAAQVLLAQFSFLDPNMVHMAKSDHLVEYYRNIDAPLLPIFLMPFTETQIEQIKQRWHDLRYARVDLWRQLGWATKALDANRGMKPVQTHPDYLLTQRSLGQLQGHIWAFIAPAPDYYRAAVANEIDNQRRRVQSISTARNQEMCLSLAVVQTEYLSFLLAALLETPTCFQPGNAREITPCEP